MFTFNHKYFTLPSKTVPDKHFLQVDDSASYWLPSMITPSVVISIPSVMISIPSMVISIPSMTPSVVTVTVAPVAVVVLLLALVIVTSAVATVTGERVVNEGHEYHGDQGQPLHL